MSVVAAPESARPRDPVFDTALDTCSLIEASAGTGKTYALAGLFARAVILERLCVPQILAVTYTVAATQELHERVRSRLQIAARLAMHWRAGDPPENSQDNADTALLRRLLHAALNDGAGETLQALRRRLARAQREMDQAAITTIHGFCQRVLSEHALHTGQPLLAATLEPQTRAQRLQLATQLWRQFGRQPDDADFLRRQFRDIAGLARALRELLAPEPLLPLPKIELPPDPQPQLQVAWTALQQAHAQFGEQARADVAEALRAKVLNANKYGATTLDPLWPWLQAAVRSGHPPAAVHGKLEKLTPAALREGCNQSGRGREPVSPLFEAIAAVLAAHAQCQTWREAADLQRLHRLRAAAFERDAARQAAYNVRDFDALVTAVHAAVTDATRGPALAQALRTRFPLALVDEFQDTDARQWAIFASVFASAGLVLVGDPKQAIYRFRGGDVHTYLSARAVTPLAEPLNRNFRSRPSLLAAIAALFRHAPPDAMGAGIAFTPVLPGGHMGDDVYLIDQHPAPALHFHVLPPSGNDGKGRSRDWTKPESVAHAAQLCAAAVADVLRLAQDGRAQLRDGGSLRALEARDCAVLVRTHEEAMAVQQALSAMGVPAVASGRRSLFDSDEAQELLTLLTAVAAPGDASRLRAALATRLLGWDAARLRQLEEDNEQSLRLQQTFDQWRMQWEQHGPQALLTHVLAHNAARLLGQFEGERRLTHLLHLGELMQQARAARLGTQGQIDWLRTSIATADPDDEQQWPRLESDASRVQIRTLHASKGLEFPLVFLPFVAIGRGNGNRKDFVVYQHQDERVRQWKTSHLVAEPSWNQAQRAADAEDAAEDMRLLYVGLTRASHALWLCGGALANTSSSALHRLLGGALPQADVLHGLGGSVRLSEGLPVAGAPLPARAPFALPPVRQAIRVLPRDWWIHSFSQLHRYKPHGAHTLIEEAPAMDERTLADANEGAHAIDPRFRGERFGNAVHYAFEHVDFAQWQGCEGASPPAGQRPVLIDALNSQDYPIADYADGVDELSRLVAATLNAPLPEGGRLCDLTPVDRVAEIEFHFALADADSAGLLALLHRHGIATGRTALGTWSRLSGLMTGKIDLTYRRDGRVYVLDYKSNVLPGYDQAAMEQAMRASEYDLQALLYVLALHRWLRLRRGRAYDYARDIGGVRYLFCRGLQRDQPARGIMAFGFDPALIEAVDALLAPGSPCA